MCKYSKFNDAANYRRMTEELVCSDIPNVPIFAAQPNESIVHTFIEYHLTSGEELRDLLDDIDMAVIDAVATSKYLTSRQIFEYITLRGYDVARPRLRKRILKLMKNRVIQENELTVSETIRPVKYYALDYWGFQLALENGVAFTMGNRYISYNRRKEKGIHDETAVDVKRVLMGNQIITGLLKANVMMDRFAVMDTFRAYNQYQEAECAMVRTAAYVRLTPDSILAYEVVRNTHDACQKLVDKVQRYFNLVHSTTYLEGNYHGDAEYPQLVICGENLSHNIRIAETLRENGLWSEEDPILFTEDLLNMGHTRTSIYQINDDNTQSWFELPSAVNAEEEHAA